MSPIKVVMPGETPLERLTEFTKRVLAVSKSDISKKMLAPRRKRRRKRKK